MEELASERQVLKRALAERDIDAWVFEADAGGRSTSIQETYRRELAAAHLYVGLFWNGFGEYTIDEFEYARELEKDCLIFEKREGIDGKRDPKLQEFLKRLEDVKRGLTIRRFHTLEELAAYVKTDVAAWQTDTIERLHLARSQMPFEAPPLSDKHVLREALLAQMKTTLVPGGGQSARVTRATLHGAGGVGKSIVAAAFAHDPDVSACFPHGTLWAHVGDNPDALAVLSSWGRSLRDPDMPAAGYASQSAGTNQLRTVLKDKACLLVLDDVWHPDLIREAFLVGGPRCLLLITTRKSEVARSIAATQTDVAEMIEDEALALLTKWVGILSGDDENAARWFARQVGYLPLALELIGAGVAKLADWKEYRARWDEQALSALRRGRGASGKQDNLKDSIALSLQFLAGDEDRRNYVRLAVFPKGTPFPATACAALFQWTEADASEFLLDIVGQALLTRQPSALGPRYRMHDLLHDFAAERLGTEALEDAHRSLAKGYEKRCAGQWASAPDDGYFFEQIARHLSAGRLLADLDKLIDKVWMDAKLRLTHSHRSFYQDVELAIGLAMSQNPPPLLPLMRGCLIKNTLSSVASTIPPPLIGVLALGDQVERARGYAGMIPDAATRCDAWLSIADALAARRDPTSAIDDLLQAIACEAQVKEGADERRQKIDHAITTLSTTCSPADVLRAASNSPIAPTVIERMVEHAMNSTGQEEATSELLALGSLETLPLMLRVGQFDRALTLARSCANEDTRLWYLRAITRAVIEAGDLDRALAIAEEEERLWKTYYSDFSFVELVVGRLTQEESPSTIADMISGVRHADLRGRIIERAVGELARRGDTARAQDVATRVADEEHRDLATYVIVSTLIKRQTIDAAWTVTTSMQGRWRAVAGAGVAKARAEAGQSDDARLAAHDALSNVDRIESNFTKAVTLARVAESLGRIGDVDDAIGLIGRATGMLAAEDDYHKDRIATHLAVASAVAGRYDEARQIARAMKSWNRSAGFIELGKVMVAAGEHTRAVDLLSDLTGDHDKLTFLKTIGPALVAKDAYDGVSTALEALDGQYYKEEALKPTIDAAIQRRAFREALRWLEMLESYYRRDLLNVLIQPMLDAGEAVMLMNAAYNMDHQGVVWDLIMRVARKRVHEGEFDETYRADGIDIADEKRSELQLHVARALIEDGSLDRARTAAIKNDGYYRDDAITETAVALVKAGRLPDALELVGQLKHQDEGRLALAFALVDMHETAAALELAQRIDATHYRRNDLLESICKAQLQGGSDDAARSTAAMVTREELRTDLLAQVAWSFAKGGRVRDGVTLAEDLLRALESGVEPQPRERLVWRATHVLEALSAPAAKPVQQIAEASNRGERLQAAVIAALEVDDVDGALAIVDAVPLEPYSNRWDRMEATVTVAERVARAGPSERARLLARSAIDAAIAVIGLQSPMMRVFNKTTYKLLATGWASLARGGGFQSALELIAAIKAADLANDDVLAALAPTLAASGRVEWALDVAEAIADPSDKAQSLVATADALRSEGDTRRSLEMGRLALRVAQGLEHWPRTNALSLVASALIRAGDTELWKETLSLGTDPGDSTDAAIESKDVAVVASQAALALSDCGHAALAVEVARTYRTSAGGESLGRFGVVFARHGAAPEAEEVARSLIGRGGDEVAAQTAEIWATIGQPANSLAALDHVHNVDVRRRVIGILARQVPREGRQEATRFWSEATAGIEPATSRARMLAFVAAELEGTALREHAIAVLARALTETRDTDRATVLDVVTTGIPILARIDNGDLLRRIRDQVLMIESWWTPGVAAQATA